VARDVFKGRGVRKLEFTTGGAEAVASLSAKAYPLYNGRGVARYMESYVLHQIVTALDIYETAQNAQHTEEHTTRKSHGVAMRVTARKPLEAFHRAQFDVEIEPSKEPEKKESSWRKFTGFKKDEL